MGNLERVVKRVSTTITHRFPQNAEYVRGVVDDVGYAICHGTQRDRHEHIRQEVVEISRQDQVLDFALQLDALVVARDEVEQKG